MAYQPATNLTTDVGKTHQQTTFWKRTALSALMKRTYFRSATEPDSIPLRSGQTVQWWRPTLPGANTTPSSEGTVGQGLSYDTGVVTATIRQYSDYWTVSKLYNLTAIDSPGGPFGTLTKLAGYRGALTVDTLIRIELDTTTAVDQATFGASFAGADIRFSVADLNANDVFDGPRGQDRFLLIAHPYMLFDMKSDNTVGGFIDIMKYANPQAALAGEVGSFDNARIVASTNVSTTGAAPNVIYRNYLIGNETIGAVDLPGNGPDAIIDPNNQSFGVNVIKGGPDKSDMEGNIAGGVSYWFTFVAKLLHTSNTNRRHRRILADASAV